MDTKTAAMRRAMKKGRGMKLNYSVELVVPPLIMVLLPEVDPGTVSQVLLTEL